jgi:hypothetical protein
VRGTEREWSGSGDEWEGEAGSAGTEIGVPAVWPVAGDVGFNTGGERGGDTLIRQLRKVT